MGLKSEVDQLFNAFVESGNVRTTGWPAGASIAVVSDGVVAAWAWAPYVQIVAAAVVPNPCWLVGVLLHLPVVEAFYGDFQIASGAALAEVPLVTIPFDEELFAVVEGKNGINWLPYPVRIAGSPRIAGRLRKNTAASAAGASCRFVVAANVGS